MTKDRQRRVARAGSITAAVVAAICAAILIADYAVARMRFSPEAERVAALQQQTETDASVAPTLAAEHDRITRTRQARKTRSSALSMLLIAAASAFVAGAKWMTALDRSRPAAPLIPLASLRTSPAAVHPTVTVREESPVEQPCSSGCGTSGFEASGPAGVDLTFVDRIVEQEGRTSEAAIPILQAIQAHYRYLPDEALRRVTELTEVTAAQIAGTSSFYARFRRSPVGEHIVRVCHGTACHVAGARQITEELRRQLRIPDDADTDPERMFTLDEVACLGCCSLAPVLMVDDRTAGRLTPAAAFAALEVVHRA